MIKELTLARLKHFSFSNEYKLFFSLYTRLFLEEELTSDDINKILSIVVLFSNQKEPAIRNLGYRMALVYGNKVNDFSPLYDISINTGLIPVAALIRSIEDTTTPGDLKSDDSFMTAIAASFVDFYRRDNIVFTEQQFRLDEFFDKNAETSTTVVAPTSYGKSELIISFIKKSKGKNICILVPSKSLLAQTRKRLLDANIGWVLKIVSHPEVHVAGNIGVVYILTQERLTRVLNLDKKMFFDIVFIDEAHNIILEKDGRNVLLASVVKILEYRNSETAFKFLTPFLRDPSNLTIRDSSIITSDYHVSEYVKSEILFIADFKNGNNDLQLYDHFVDEYIPIKNAFVDEISYIKNHSLGKNLLYFNRPKDIQQFAKIFSDSLPRIDLRKISDALDEISNSTNEKYLLLDCIRHGVVYHHGSMSESLRNYVEYIFRSNTDIRFLISNSTLLEGVNLPIQRMFLLSISKGQGNLKRSQFKNLIGRINRFSEIFSKDNVAALEKLQPEIHIVATDHYVRRDANLKSFCSDVMKVSKKDSDIVENALLKHTKIDEKNSLEYDRVLTRLTNLEPGISENFSGQKITTSVGLKLLENNILEIDIYDCELAIQSILDRSLTENGLINNSNALMALIYNAFVAFIDPNTNTSKSSLSRLQSDKAQTFYAMFLDWSIKNTPFSFMISRFIEYWDRLPTDTPVFVGSWGDTAKDGGHRKHFTYMAEKDQSEKINLAIVRIKEEEDFFGYTIFRFIDVLNDLGMLDPGFYSLAKYGSTDPKIIMLIKHGFSRATAEALIKEYSNFVDFLDGQNVSIDPAIHAELTRRRAGFLRIHEVSLNVMGMAE